jgi:16S rRNA processing protein RimM
VSGRNAGHDGGRESKQPDPGEDSAPEYLTIGRVRSAHGVRGEVRVEVLTDFPELRFRPGAELFVGPEQGERRPGRIAGVRGHGGSLLVRLDGVGDRDAALGLAGQSLWIRTSSAQRLPADSYYEHELVGLDVVTSDGTEIGRVTALMETGATDVIVVRGAGAVRLLPLTKEVVRVVDLESRRIQIEVLPGLLD